MRHAIAVPRSLRGQGAAALVALTVTVTACAGGVVASASLRGEYVTTIKPTSPCAMSTRQVRAHHGYEDDLCAAWIDRHGRVHVGPLSDAPARAHMVGE